MSCMCTLTEHPFLKWGCSCLAGVCSSPCGPHTEPRDSYLQVERVLSITAAKSVIVYTPKNNKVQQLSQKQIFPAADTTAGWCGEHFHAQLVHTSKTMGKGSSSTTTWPLHLTLTFRYSLQFTGLLAVSSRSLGPFWEHLRVFLLFE